MANGGSNFDYGAHWDSSNGDTHAVRSSIVCLDEKESEEHWIGAITLRQMIIDEREKIETKKGSRTATLLHSLSQIK